MEIRSKYHPRAYQLPILNALDSGKKRVVLCAHRRCGKDITILNWCIAKLIEEPCSCYYILPTYSQAKKIIWDSLTNDGMRILDYFPREFVTQMNSQEMKIRFGNGSLFQLIGSENIDSLMGTNPKIVVFSEYALQSPQAWNFLSPILKVNGGTAIFISTPRGKNHFYDLYNYAKTDPAWYCERLTIDDTKVLSKADVDKEIAEGMSEELAMQEYYVSFDRGVEGSYYGKLIDKARAEGRIGNVQYMPSAAVNSAWDLGWRDSTAITFWQDIGGECRIIDHYEAQGEKMDHYAKVLKDKPYLYGTHFLPHDAASQDAKSRTYQDILYDLGIKTTCLARETDIGPGIESVRTLLCMCCIDETRCRHLIKCLENYHKQYNEKTQSYSDSPKHDWTSHSADSVRYLARARLEFGRGPGSMSIERLNQLKANASAKTAPNLANKQAPMPYQRNLR